MGNPTTSSTAAVSSASLKVTAIAIQFIAYFGEGRMNP
jgi:hypothetical protein